MATENPWRGRESHAGPTPLVGVVVEKGVRALGRRATRCRAETARERDRGAEQQCYDDECVSNRPSPMWAPLWRSRPMSVPRCARLWVSRSSETRVPLGAFAVHVEGRVVSVGEAGGGEQRHPALGEGLGGRSTGNGRVARLFGNPLREHACEESPREFPGVHLPHRMLLHRIGPTPPRDTVVRVGARPQGAAGTAWQAPGVHRRALRARAHARAVEIYRCPMPFERSWVSSFLGLGARCYVYGCPAAMEPSAWIARPRSRPFARAHEPAGEEE